MKTTQGRATKYERPQKEHTRWEINASNNTTTTDLGELSCISHIKSNIHLFKLSRKIFSCTLFPPPSLGHQAMICNHIPLHQPVFCMHSGSMCNNESDTCSWGMEATFINTLNNCHQCFLSLRKTYKKYHMPSTFSWNFMFLYSCKLQECLLADLSHSHLLEPQKCILSHRHITN